MNAEWIMATLWHQRQRLRKLMPFASSLLIHAVILLALAMWVLPILSKGMDIVPIDAAFTPKATDAQTEITQEAVEISASANLQPWNELLTESVTQPLDPPKPGAPITVAAPRDLRVLAPAIPNVDWMSDKEMLAEIPMTMSAMPMHRHRGETRVAEAEDTNDIAQTLQGDLMSMAKDGDALVVWMLDQSLSMQLDMKSLAEKLVSTLQEIERDKDTNVQHYVIAFGENAGVVQNASDRGLQVAKAIYNLPADPSGVENTFQSVEWCIENLFKAPRWFRDKQRQRLLVIWTDESADDYLRLEHTIQLCHQADVRVDIIGPSAVLGAQTGYTAYQHPADGRVYYLPVHRGPDSSFPQKLALGYWHRGVPRGFDESFRGPHQGLSPKWQGGTNMDSMLSGFSPYALTRLARQTGGRYTIYDRPGDRPPFRLEQIKDYTPDYTSISEIGFQLRRQPLRQLVLAASALTWQSKHTGHSEPRMYFRPERGGEQGVQYRRNTLPRKLKPAIIEAYATARDVERALSIFANAATAPGFRPRQDHSDRVRRTSSSDVPADDKKPATAETPPTTDDDQKPPVATIEDSEQKPGTEEADAAGADDKVDLRAIEVIVNESLLEQLYQREESKRWRAWCDLNMGRLLAVSVRLREYLTITTMLLKNTNSLNADTNYVKFAHSKKLMGGPVATQRAALAQRLLQRCIDQNPGTPWAVLAERELRDGFGLQITQQYVPPPRPSGPSGPAPVRPKMPNL